jgi:cation transport ATPase
MNKVLLGVRGLTDADAAARVVKALTGLKGVREVVQAQTAQLEVTYDPAQVTVMDLLRTVRGQGFLAGML